MRNRLLLSYGALVLAVLVALGVPLGVTFARGERRDLEQRVQHDALALALLSAEQLEQRQFDSLRGIVHDYTARSGARVVITDAKGTSVADSEDDRRELGRDFSTRPEVSDALRGEESIGTRFSDTDGRDLLYVAVPVATGGRIHGSVRVTYPTSFVQARIYRVWAVLAAVGALILAVSVLVAAALARALSAPLRDLAATAQRLGAGDLQARADSSTSLPEVAVLAEVLNDSAAKLDVLVTRQREFVSHASHQLRSPLAALRLRLENLQEDLDGERAASAAACLGEVQRLSRLVDGLLTLARLDEAAAAPLPISLDDVVADRIEVWAPYAAERSVLLERESDRPVAALATPGHLEQVLDNLISNALEVSPPGSRLTLRVDERRDLAEVHVVDQGPGLPTEERERAFDRFWRSGTSHATSGGTGLGLAIAQRLVTADGGRIALEPAPSGGLDAVVRLRRSDLTVPVRRYDLPADL